jgi:three-Cys-motif partner protein
MGRSTSGEDCIKHLPLLFQSADIPKVPVPPARDFKSLQHPLWTENKARLIEEYIRLFTYITKHGAYIDGFAAPQRRERMDLCSAKLVIQAEPKLVRDFWLCDIDIVGIGLLRELAAANATKGRRIEVIAGDFNETVDDILASGRIKEKTASFALLDQRTFECNWATVQKLARHKADMKIEIFYFLATGWLDRSIAAVRLPDTAAKLNRWWGRSDWRDLQGMDGITRAKMVSERFKRELGYSYAYPYSIHSEKRRGRTMYHMIHATDHRDAPPLMLRAYRKISGRHDADSPAQLEMDALWQETVSG